MPFAAHPKDNGRDSQDGHDDAGCKEIAIPVGAALKGSLGFHDESSISRSSRYQPVSLVISFRRCNELRRREPTMQTTTRAKWHNGAPGST